MTIIDIISRLCQGLFSQNGLDCINTRMTRHILSVLHYVKQREYVFWVKKDRAVRGVKRVGYFHHIYDVGV